MGLFEVRCVFVAAAVLFCSVNADGEHEEEDMLAIYEARQGACDYFVSVDGDDKNEGTDLQSPFATLKCACDNECNEELQRDETICILAGRYEVTDTVYVKGANMREQKLKIMALGHDRSVILDGMGQAALFNALQTHTTFTGIVFEHGFGTSGGAVYGERGLAFNHCVFAGNEASVHGGAVMGGRLLEFYDCEFLDNSAKFAGAVRVNDIGSAIIEDCQFFGNYASGRGGALVTQIEKPEEHYVKVKNTLFCFNESPMSPHIYNYRTSTHECTDCRFNSKQCCNGNGHVVSIGDVDDYVLPEARRAILAMQRPETTPGVSFDSQQRLEQLDHVGTDSHDTVSPNGL
eukprot:m.391502 g.391502  ORF g.391502 m.391502 type:complete len:347 (+) comp21074_c0_seq24:159-1199(+)